MTRTGRSTAFFASDELADWLVQQAKIRDTTASGLIRCLLRSARQQVAEGGRPTGWPEAVEAWGHKRTIGLQMSDQNDEFT